MMKPLLFVFILYSSFLSAQTVYEIPWEPGVNNAVASPTIEVGDAVKWIWSDGSPKSVTSLRGGKEVFDSGVLDGKNAYFSHTFTQLGITEYENEINPAMSGKVTVVRKLSVEDKFLKNLNFYPNPVRNNLTISSQFKLDSYQVFNVLGSLVVEGKGSGKTTRIDMSQLNSGLYFVKVVSNGMQSTLKIAKE